MDTPLPLPPPLPSVVRLHIHRGGQFRLWDAESVRALATDKEWRILGEAPPASIAPHAAAANEPEGEQLPIGLQAVQALWLFRQQLRGAGAASASRHQLEFVDATSLAAMRRSTARGNRLRSGVDKHGWLQSRIQAMQDDMAQAAREQAEMRAKYEGQGKRRRKEKTQQQQSGTTIAAAATAAGEEEKRDVTGEEDDASSSSKRQKVADGGAAGVSATSIRVGNPAFPGVDGVEAAPSTVAEMAAAVLSDSTTHLPRLSSMHIAAAAFPITATTLAAHTPSHPLAIAVPIQHPADSPPLVLPRALIAVDLRVPLVHERRALDDDGGASTAGRLTRERQEELLYEGICESLGLSLHACADHSKKTSADGRRVAPYFDSPSPTSSAAASASSSSPFAAFLSQYAAFNRLQRDGHYILPGTHFGSDFTCYEAAPQQVHSTYLVKARPIMHVDRQAFDEVATAATAAAAASSSSSSPPIVAWLPSLDMDPLEVSSLGRMATGIKKEVLVVQAILPEEGHQEAEEEEAPAAAAPPALDQLGGIDGPSPASPAACPSSRSCACLVAFRRHLDRLDRLARFDCSSFEWISGVGIYHTAYPDTARRKPPQGKGATNSKESQRGQTSDTQPGSEAQAMEM